MGHIVEMCDVFMDVLGEDADNGIEVHMVSKFQGLTMDYLGRAAFGIDTSFQRDLNHPFLITAKEAAHGLMTGPVHMLARKFRHFFCFPEEKTFLFVHHNHTKQKSGIDVF